MNNGPVVKILMLCALVVGGDVMSVATVNGASESAAQSLVGELNRSGIPARFGISLGASSNSATPLEGYLRAALSESQLLQTRYAEYLAARAAVAEVTSLPDPKLGYTEYVQPVETRVGPQERAFSLSQAFPWFGSLSLHGDVKRSHAEAARSRLYGAALEVIADVKRAYYDIGYLERAIEITNRHIGLLTQWEEVARVRYSSASGQYADVIKAQVESGVLNNRLAELQDQRRPVAAVLNALLDRDSGAAVVYSAPLAEGLVALDLPELATLMQANNPLLAVWDHRAQASLDADLLAKKNGLPSFTVGVNYILTGDARTEGLRDSGKDALMASVAVSLPIWRGKHAAASDVAVNRYHAAVSAKRDLSNALSSGLERAHFRYRDAHRKTNLYRTTLLPKGRQSLGATRTAYEAGQSGFLDLVDAERLVLEFELSLVRAEFDVLIQTAEIEKFVAGPVGGPTSAIE